MSVMDGFCKQTFCGPVAGVPKSFDVYTLGKGPAVIVMQEMPGIGPKFLSFCRRLAAEGFEVWVPHWFGPLGKTSAANLVRVLCMRRAFNLFAKHKSGGMVDWMRALCAHVAASRKVERVGVVGMCLTGNFAMTLIADEHVWAAVASQPLPEQGGRVRAQARGKVLGRFPARISFGGLVYLSQMEALVLVVRACCAVIDLDAGRAHDFMSRDRALASGEGTWS